MTRTTFQSRPFRSAGRGAFTLVEVMISVALVLMVIYGVARVFKLSSEAIGANQSVAAMVRDNRSTAATLGEDFRNCVADSPIFLISSRVAFEGTGRKFTYDGQSISRGHMSGFLNAEEARLDVDPAPDPDSTTADPRTYVVNGSQYRAGLADGSDRIPRLDRLGFFARGMYRRQTSDTNRAYSPITSNEAFIWIGHTAHPGLHGGNQNAPLQPNDQFASERILGRMAFLLKDNEYVKSLGANVKPRNTPDDINKPEDQRSEYYADVPATARVSYPLSPLGYENQLKHKWIGRFDLAGTTIEQFRKVANDLYLGTKNEIATQVPGSYPSSTMTWYRSLDTIGADNFRVQCDPTPARPINPDGMALAAPVFVPNCVQFIVEYAGDFTSQDEEGYITNVGQWVETDATKADAVRYGGGAGLPTDGVIDYIVDGPRLASGKLDPAKKAQWSRRIRWYGMPREVTGVDANGVVRLDERDVVPFRDVVFAMADQTKFTPVKDKAFRRAPWEVEWPGMVRKYSNPVPGGKLAGVALYNTDPAGATVKDNDYLKLEQTSGYTVPLNDTQNLSSLFRYVCAWHNDSPPLIRVTMKVIDSNQRLTEGQWYEYVLSR
ncbi:MAG: PilW family protein [Phycisphaerae bacterium]|nr:hypothetical protein [Tepidisphaeraceae bacterium]